MIELILDVFIANCIGKPTRYLFFKIIGRKKSMKYLSGDSKKHLDMLSQNFYNLMVGAIILLSTLLLFAWGYDSLTS